MRWFLPLPVLGPMAALCLVSGCTPASDARAAEWRGSIDTVNAVVRVSNPAEPLLRTGEATATELWTTGGDTDLTARFEQPRWVVAGPDRLYVLDAMARRIFVFHPASGAVEQTIGKEGAGPGEFLRPFGLALAGNRIVVGDGGKGALDLLHPDGAPDRSIPLAGVGFGLWGTDSGSVVVSMLGAGGGALRQIGLDGTVHEIRISEPMDEAQVDGARCQHNAVAGEKLMQASCFVPTFRVMDLAGNVHRHVAIAADPQRASDAELSRIEADMRAKVAEVGYPPATLKEVVDEMVRESRVKRIVRRAVFDPDGALYAIWEQAPEDLGGGSATLHLLNEVGVYLAKLDFDSPWVDFAFAGQTVYALVEDAETGLVSVTAYRIALPDYVDRAAR